MPWPSAEIPSRPRDDSPSRSCRPMTAAFLTFPPVAAESFRPRRANAVGTQEDADSQRIVGLFLTHGAVCAAAGLTRFPCQTILRYQFLVAARVAEYLRRNHSEQQGSRWN